MLDSRQILTPAPDAPRRRGRPRKTTSSDSGRRAALIATAARHFRDKGFDATTTRDIASAAGMRSGSPFYHFKSKNALLFAVMEEGMLVAQRSQDAVLDELPSGCPARDTLATLVLNHLYVLWLPGNDFVPVMHHEWRSITPAQRRKIQGLKDAYEAPWQVVLEELESGRRLGTDASLARSMLFSILNGSMRWFRPTGKLRLEQLAGECLNAMVARVPSETVPDPVSLFDPVPLVRRVWHQAMSERLGARPAEPVATSPVRS